MKQPGKVSLPIALHVYVNIACLGIVGMGFAVMAGWLLEIDPLKSVLPGLPAMRFNTALCFLLLGGSLWLLQDEDASLGRKRTGNVLASFALIISLLTLVEYLFRLDLGIDQLIVPDLDSPAELFPGRMAPVAVLCAGFTGVGLLMLGTRISQYFSLCVTVLSLAGMMSSLLNLEILRQNPGFTYVGLHASLAYMLLSTALIAARPTQGMMKMLVSDLSGSKAMRLLLPVIVIVTSFAAWLVERAEDMGVLDTSNESVFLAILLIFIYSPLIYGIARVTNQAQETLYQSEERFRRAIQEAPNPILIHAEDGEVMTINRAWIEQTGYHAGEIPTIEAWIEKAYRERAGAVREEIERLYAAASRVDEGEDKIFTAGGDVRTWKFTSAPLGRSPDGRRIVISMADDITELKNAEKKLLRNEEVLRLFVEHSPAAIAMFDNEMRYIVASRRYLVDYGLGELNLVGESHYDIFPEVPERWKEIHRRCLAGAVERSEEDPFPRSDGHVDWVRWEIRPWYELNGSIGGIILFSEVITARKQAEEKFRLAIEAAPNAILMVDSSGAILLVNSQTEKYFGYDRLELLGKTVDQLVPTRYRSDHAGFRVGYLAEPQARTMGMGRDLFGLRKDGSEFPAEIGISPIETESGMLFLATVVDVTQRKKAEEAIQESARQMNALVTSLDDIVFEFDEQGTYLNVWAADESLLALPKAQMIGTRISDVLGEESGRLFEEAIHRVLQSGQPEDIEYPLDMLDGQHWFIARINPIVTPSGNTTSMLIRDITSRKQAEKIVKTQLERLTALREIDRTIISTSNVQLSLSILLTQTLALLSIDAGDILLVNPALNILEFAAGKGFRTKTIENAQVRLGEGLAGRAALTGKTIEITDLTWAQLNPFFKSLIQEEEFISYVGIPLVSKGKVLGVLEAYQRSAVHRDPDWLDFLESLAGQASIAIDNAQSFDGMQRLNMELIVAYDATIEGWSRAMDLRDRETEGHTQRVTELTLKLAQRMGLRMEEQAQMRRGALLHDIGKLGIPDSILLKPGKLADDEWEIMKRHPALARDMLSPIVYLRLAIDIPYCHHEKWDGTGYPRGLRGEEIPLSARIFAIVDVWDALTSDRPYRSAWPREKVREYIREQSGKHFDPRVVEAFLEMMMEA